jgi:hypothetical protein
MFGVVRPCRHRLCGPLFGEWTAHLCGLCLTLRDLCGQNARLATNYDGLLVSVLTQAQNPVTAPFRTAGPCALRGFRRAEVADSSGPGVQLAAAVSLIIAVAKIHDHINDRDGVYARRAVASAVKRAASRWQAGGEHVSGAIGFDAAVLTSAVDRQAEIEQAGGLDLLELTEPTETAVSAAFAHTAVLAGQPSNAGPLATAGRSFGRLVHLLDAVEDLPADSAAAAYNPLLATGTPLQRAREYCDEAVLDLRTAIGKARLVDRALTESLLFTEVGVAVDKAFAKARRGWTGSSCGSRPGQASSPRRLVAGLPCVQLTYHPGRGDVCCDECCDLCCDACCTDLC